VKYLLVYIVMTILTIGFALLWYKSQQLVPATELSQNRKKMVSNIFFILTFLPMFCVTAFAYNSGNDYITYRTYFSRISQGIEQSVDIGYKLLNVIVAKLGLEFQWVVIITVFIGFCFLGLAIKKQAGNYMIACLLFIISGYFFLLGMNQIRQLVAVAVACYALRYISENSFGKYLFFVLLAGTFHFTAFVMIPFYWILKKEWKASFYLALSVLLLPFNFIFNQVVTFLFATFLPRYLNSNYVNKELTLDIPYLAMIGITFIIVLVLYSQCEKTLSHTILFNSTMFAFVLAAFASWMPEHKRFIYYFYVPAFFLTSKCIPTVKNRLLRWGIMALQIAFCLLYLNMASSSWGVGVYQTIF